MIGIYCIKNKVNNKVYIGSSNDIARRFRRHRTELNTGRHSNEYLSKAYLKYGKENFEFIILEVCTQEKLISKEAEYIQKFNSLDSLYGYNLTIPVLHPSITSNKEYRNILSSAKKGIKPDNFEKMQQTRWKKIKAYKNDVFVGEFNSYNHAERELGLKIGYLYSYFKKTTVNRRMYKEFKFERI